MKTKLKFAALALVLAGALSSAYAKDGGNGNGPPLETPAVSGPLAALIDEFLSDDQTPPQGLGNVPQSYRQEWLALLEPPFGHSHGTTPPVPEPETYALMLAGLGALAIFRKRRRDN